MTHDRMIQVVTDAMEELCIANSRYMSPELDADDEAGLDTLDANDECAIRMEAVVDAMMATSKALEVLGAVMKFWGLRVYDIDTY